MTRRDAFNLIYRDIGAIVADFSFELVRHKEGFARRIPGGVQEIGIPFYDYDPDYEFSVVLSIRLDIVENITNQFSGSPPEFHSETETNGT